MSPTKIWHSRIWFVKSRLIVESYFLFFCSLIHMDVAMYMKLAGAVAIFSNGGGVRDRNTARTGDRRRGGGNFYFTAQRSGAIPNRSGGYSPECPGGLTTSMLIHILICDIGGVFWTPPPNSAGQNSRPYYFLCTPPPWRRPAAPLHFTPLSYFTASPHHGGSVFCTWYLYKNRLYVMIYWEK